MQALILHVESLARAKDYLHANGLLGDMSERAIALKSGEVHGLDIRLMECGADELAGDHFVV